MPASASGTSLPGGREPSVPSDDRSSEDKNRMMAEPLFSFGVISDVQYVDQDDGNNYERTRVRYYRSSLVQLRRAVNAWSADHIGCGVAFILQLGDLLDGKNSTADGVASHDVLSLLLAVFNTLPPDAAVHHCVGNHELYCMSHATAVRRLWPTLAGVAVSPKIFDPSCSDDAAYYSFSPRPGFRFIKLDHYEIAAIGHSSNSASHARAVRYLHVNVNEVKDSDDNLDGLDKRFVAYNGAMSERQLAWLEQLLRVAEDDGEKVFIFGHQGILASHADSRCLLWNFEAVCEILSHFRCVVMHLSGHEHNFWYARDAKGVHHLSLPGVVETKPESDAYGTFRVFQSGVRLDGVGELPSGWFDYKHTEKRLENGESSV